MKPHFLIAAGLLAAATTGHAALVAHYKFDESADATVAANELAGTAGQVGSLVTTGVSGISGSAYRFAGDGSSQDHIVDMGNASFFSAMNTSEQFSFSAWANTEDTTGNRNTIVFAGDNTSSNVYADLGVSAGQEGFEGGATARNRPVGASLDQQTGINSLPVVEPVNDGEWHHLVMTVDVPAATLSLYVDGILAATQAMTVDALPTFNNLEIGRLGRSSPVDPYQGLIDDVQVYDHALSPGEVQFLFNNPGVAVPEPGSLLLTLAGLLPLLRRRRG